MTEPVDPALLDTLSRWYHGVRNDQARAVLVGAGLVLHFDSPYGDEITERGAQLLATALRLSQLRCAWLEAEREERQGMRERLREEAGTAPAQRGAR